MLSAWDRGKLYKSWTSTSKSVFDSHTNSSDGYYFDRNWYFDTLIKISTTTYINVRNTEYVAPITNAIKEKEQYLLDVYGKYLSQEITREQYIRKIGLKFQTKSL